ncbi:hypothetical protein C7974DRAFT_443181 [Boeremia exigua]|uniref:uncharacterized protein n=1 Tax=Boeremia exigua TaxID=749465 RepID=UPI001E8CCF73|nr:uncharacterized protein C7974DRAFT_443181 [Boeremia exigua]KAH6615084.1 hypothetical protein C7974DRAFT_443181 [Boeremia exigua]
MRELIRAFGAAWLTVLAVSKAVIQPFPFTDATHLLSNASSPRIAVPFGSLEGVKFSEPSLVQAAGFNFDPNNIANDATWTKYTKKGEWYGCLLDMTIEQAGKGLKDPRTPPFAESKWQGDFRNEVSKWGWREGFYEPAIFCDFRDDPNLQVKNKISTALLELELSLLPVGRGGDNECYSIEHFHEDLVDEEGYEVPIEDQSYDVDNQEYPCTGAYYRFAVNKKGGAIFAQDLLKPQIAADRNIDEEVLPEELPQISRASDIMWLYWYRNNPTPRELHSYFVNHVQNSDTLQLVARILKNHGMAKVPYWPGLQLTMGEPALEAEALLGSPLGASLSHLLFQHKTALGVKNIEAVVIFRDNWPEPEPNAPHPVFPEVQILFKIIDVPDDELIDEDIEMPDAGGVVGRRTVSFLYEGKGNVVREHRVVVRLGAK